jgi:pemK-like protein|nr:MAG TPA: endoribonuclease [Caudoviricetes sp.]
MGKKVISNDEILTKVDNFLKELDNDRANKTKFWINDYIKFQKKEIKISSNSRHAYKKYNRGDIINVHFGFRVGREFGGLHYAIVIGGYKNRKSDVLTVIPLKSAKPTVNVDFLKNGEYYLGNDVYNAINKNLKSHYQKLTEIELLFTSKKNTLDNLKNDFNELNDIINNLTDNIDKADVSHDNSKIIMAGELLSSINNKLKEEIFDIMLKCNELGILKTDTLSNLESPTDLSSEDMKGYINTINKSLKSEFTYIKKLIIENDRMKVNGSIALLNQITTISKIRIYDPKTKTDALNNVKISDENLKNIDNELKKMLIESIDK